MIIHAYPARSNLKQNPFNFRLSAALEQNGHVVLEPGPWQSLCSKADIILLNWPQAPMQQKTLLMLRRSVMLVATLVVQRAFGAERIWIVHNTRSHNSLRPRLEKYYMRILASLLSGVVFLTEGSREIAISRHPRLATLPFTVMLHPVYDDAYPSSPDRASARASLGMATNRNIVGIVGDLKSYKGIDDFIRAFTEMQEIGVDGILAGVVTEPKLAERIESAIKRSRELGRSLTHINKRLENDQLVTVLSALDLLVLPYSSGENSGMAVLAAERGVPILARASPAISEMSQILGITAVRALEGPLDSVSLASALRNVRPAKSHQLNRFREMHSLTVAASILSELFAKLRGNRLRSGVQ